MLSRTSAAAATIQLPGARRLAASDFICSSLTITISSSSSTTTTTLPQLLLLLLLLYYYLLLLLLLVSDFRPAWL